MTTMKIALTDRIWLGEYPYTYARVSAMKEKLLKRADYDRLLKMSVTEIVKSLQDSDYRHEIDEFAGRHRGLALVEIALRKNLAGAFAKLQRISDGSLRRLLDAYLVRVDVQNLKTVLRGKFTGEKDIESLLIPAGNLSARYLQSLLAKETAVEVARAITLTDLEEGIGILEKDGTLVGIENALDTHLYSGLLSLAMRITSQGKLFRDFLQEDIGIRNIMTALRLGKEGYSSDDIQQYLFLTDEDEKRLSRLLSLAEKSAKNDMDGILSALKAMGHKDIQRHLPSGKPASIADIELALHRHMLVRTGRLWHRNPLTIDTILGYMLAKETEVRNLIMIIKAKRLSLSEDFISREIVI